MAQKGQDLPFQAGRDGHSRLFVVERDRGRAVLITTGKHRHPDGLEKTVKAKGKAPFFAGRPVRRAIHETFG